MSTLEERYRRLLALYPAEHQRLFGDEMLGVLMSGAGEGQRSPRLGESADLVWHAIWRRMGGVMRPRTHGHWSLAAAVVGVIGSLSLFAMHLRVAAGEQAWQHSFGNTGWHAPKQWVLAGLAAGLALIVLFGPRWLVVPMAWVTGAAEIVQFGVGTPSFLGSLFTGDNFIVTAWTPVLLGLTIAVVASVPQPARGGLRLLGGRGVAALLVTALVAGASVAASAWGSRVVRLPDTWYIVHPFIGGFYLPLILVAVALIGGMAVLWWRLEGPVRRRAIVILAPAGSLFVIGVQLGYFLDYPQAWVSLTLISLFIVLCFVLLKRWERTLHLLELGRQAEKAGAAGQTTPGRE